MKILTDAEVEILIRDAALPIELDVLHSLREARAALREQWEYNHHEHCGHLLPCPKDTCHWPKPDALGEETP